SYRPALLPSKISAGSCFRHRAKSTQRNLRDQQVCAPRLFARRAAAASPHGPRNLPALPESQSSMQPPQLPFALFRCRARHNMFLPREGKSHGRFSAIFYLELKTYDLELSLTSRASPANLFLPADAHRARASLRPVPRAPPARPSAPQNAWSLSQPPSRAVVSFFIWLMIARMCRTASTTLPEPASPFVRIIAAPSAMRRSASPRLRAPQTNGTR